MFEISNLVKKMAKLFFQKLRACVTGGTFFSGYNQKVRGKFFKLFRVRFETKFYETRFMSKS